MKKTLITFILCTCIGVFYVKCQTSGYRIPAIEKYQGNVGIADPIRMMSLRAIESTYDIIYFEISIATNHGMVSASSNSHRLTGRQQELIRYAVRNNIDVIYFERITYRNADGSSGFLAPLRVKLERSS